MTYSINKKSKSKASQKIFCCYGHCKEFQKEKSGIQACGVYIFLTFHF